MALDLPTQVEVDLQRSRLASVKLTKREELAFASVQDSELRGLLAQVVRALSGSQRNFETVALQFPLTPREGGVILGPESVGSNNLKAGIRQFGIVTSLPPVAAKGDRCLFSTEGALWELVYDGDATHPWVKIGGAPLQGEAFTEQSLESETGYADLPTDPLSIELPLDGEYEAQILGRIEPAAGAGNFGHLSVAVGETAASDDWSAKGQSSGAGGAQSSVPSLPIRKVADKGQSVAEKARTGGEYAVAFGPRMLIVDPVRVG